MLTHYKHINNLLTNGEYRLFYNKAQKRRVLRSFFFIRQRKKVFFCVLRKQLFYNKFGRVRQYIIRKKKFLKFYRKKNFKRKLGVSKAFRFWKRKYFLGVRLWRRYFRRRRIWRYRKHLFIKFKRRWQYRIYWALKKKGGLANIPHIYKNSTVAKSYKILDFQKNGFNIIKKRKPLYLQKINALSVLHKYVLKKYRVNTNLYTNFNNKRKRKLIFNKSRKKHYKRNKWNKIYLFFIKKTRNNYFFTVTNFFGEVLVFSSMGHAKIKTKKKRKSPEAFKVFVRFFIKKLWKFKMKGKYCLILKKRLKRYLRGFLVWKLKKIRFKLKKIIISKKKAHNGVKKQKKKRL